MKTHLQNLALPLLIAAYPIFFLYSQNAWALEVGSLLLPLGASLLVALAFYGLFFLLQRKPVSASLSTAVFLLFYFAYGYIFRQLVKINKFPVEHYMLLPLLIFIAIYAGYFLSKVKSSITTVVQRILLIVLAVLVLFNLGRVVPIEVQKVQSRQAAAPAAVPVTGANQNYPDIYYLLFDEYAGFDAIREYWHDDYVDEFEAYLKENHFFIASGSRSPTKNTGTEVTSRLNLQRYSETISTKTKLNAIENNKVMQIVKSYGYTTVAMNMAFPAIKADYRVMYNTQLVGGMAADEFRKKFFTETMFNVIYGWVQDHDHSAETQRKYLMDTLERTANLTDIPTPKFVYMHLLLPHQPFIFDENGNMLPQQASDDWHYYLGQHKYTTKMMKQLITHILENADPDNPPVIILQSDHGARNLVKKTKDNIILNGYLENYPEKYAHDILNALYLPGYDTSSLPVDMDPVKTFEYVLNFYLHAGVSVNKTVLK